MLNIIKIYRYFSQRTSFTLYFFKFLLQLFKRKQIDYGKYFDFDLQHKVIQTSIILCDLQLNHCTPVFGHAVSADAVFGVMHDL